MKKEEILHTPTNNLLLSHNHINVIATGREVFVSRCHPSLLVVLLFKPQVIEGKILRRNMHYSKTLTSPFS